MAILFKNISWRNFLSTGNSPTRIDLNSNRTTLIQGVSGAGKSTLIDALCFGLYGRAFRNINKPQLINSINGKQLEVEIEFETNSRNYRVVRGMKPQRFDIFCDNELMTQSAALRDMQLVLERQILMMSYKTFTQIVILGSTSFVPFMQLSLATRREVVEDILDISIFSVMNTLLKQHIQETNASFQHCDVEIKTRKERIDGLKKLIEVLSEKKSERLAELQNELEKLENTLKKESLTLQESINQNSELKKQINPLKEMVGTRNKIGEQISKLKFEQETNNKKYTFFSQNNNCPTCRQEICQTHKERIFGEIEEFQRDFALINEKTNKEYEKISFDIDVLKKCVEQYQELSHKIRTSETKINELNEKKLDIVQTINKLELESLGVGKYKQELKTTAREILEFIEKKKALAQDLAIQDNANLLLKDSGVKSAIIAEFLPLINKKINHYISELQLDVEFVLDEQFNETVKSRYRDEFQYGNFSEGEKLRIDIALMMTWRYIARAINSTHTNLLIVDEILSGRLDSSNQDAVIEMLNTFSETNNTNVFVIAHQDSLLDKFDTNIVFTKQKNFSVTV